MPYVILHNNDSQGSRAPEFAEHVAGLARVSRRNGQFTEQTTAGVAALAEQNRNVIWMGHSNGERGQILTSGGRTITSNSFCQLILPLQPERLVIASC